MITDKLPPRILNAILLILIPAIVGTVWLTLTYQLTILDGLAMSEAEKEVRKGSIYMMMYAHIAFSLASAMLVMRRFRAWRVVLIALVLMIFCYDWWGVYQARFGIMDKAATVQNNSAKRAEDLRKTINGLSVTAQNRRDFAPRLANNKMITKGNDSLADSSKLETDAAEFTRELLKIEDGATTEVKVLGGEEGARFRAMAESTLIALVLGAASFLAGAMLGERMQLSFDARPTPAPEPATPTKPAPGLFVRAGRWLGVLVGGAAAAAPAHAAPVSHSAPAAPAKPAPSAPACTPADADALMSPAPTAPAKPASAPDAPAPKPAPVEPATLAPDTLPQVQQVRSAEPDAPGKVQVQSVRRKLPDGVREAVRSGAVRPTQAGLKSLGVGQGYAAEWLAQLCAEGITERDGKGYKLKGGVV